MWTTPVHEGEDPAPHMARIQSAHAQLNEGGEQLSDQMLAYAMTMALPTTFGTLKQSLWLQSPLSSASAVSAVHAKWSRRHNDPVTGNALVAKPNSNQFQQKSHSNRNTPKDQSKWCDYHKKHGHNNSECFYQQKTKQSTDSTLVTPSANIALLSMASTDTHSDLEGSAFITSTHIFEGNFKDQSFIIDSGASHHMVNDVSLLSNCTPCNINITVGNGAQLACCQAPPTNVPIVRLFRHVRLIRRT